MRYSVVLWDFDGTLADTLKLALRVYNEMAAEKGFRPITDPHAVRDMSMGQFLKSHCIAAHRVPFAFARVLKAIKAEAANVRLNEGIKSTLTALKAAGIRQCVVSSNATENIERCVAANQVADVFEFICGTSRILGKSRSIQSAIKDLQVSASEVLYVGDEIRDIEAAETAKIDVAAVTWGLNSENALRAKKPTWLVSHPSELLKSIE